MFNKKKISYHFTKNPKDNYCWYGVDRTAGHIMNVILGFIIFFVFAFTVWYLIHNLLPLKKAGHYKQKITVVSVSQKFYNYNRSAITYVKDVNNVIYSFDRDDIGQKKYNLLTDNIKPDNDYNCDIEGTYDDDRTIKWCDIHVVVDSATDWVVKK